MHLQECYKEFNGISLPITEQTANEELRLPISPSITKEECNEIVSAINSFK